MNNEQPPVVTKDTIETELMRDVGRIAAEGIPVAERLEKVEDVGEILSLFNKKGEQARKESTLKQNIFRTLKTAFLGTSNIGNFFCNETREQIKAWFNNPSINKFSTKDIERILSEAAKENYEGRLGTKQAENGKMEICYIPSKDAGWSVDKTKVME